MTPAPKMKPHVWVVIRERWTSETHVVRDVRVFADEPKIRSSESVQVMRIVVENTRKELPQDE